MFQRHHRGIYEYLWSEHKYVALGVSFKAFQTTAARLGTIRQCRSMLKKLVNYALAEKPELLSALLSAYMHIKPCLDRSERESLIKALLQNETDAAEMIYRQVIKSAESTLFGCRLFFPSGKAVEKFWDAQHHPGLWVCFGPFQMHWRPEELLWRFKVCEEVTDSELNQVFIELSSGVSLASYQQWPHSLRQILENCNMVATPGKTAFLHPRALSALQGRNPAAPQHDIFRLAAISIEKLWENETTTYPGELPEFSQFKPMFASIQQLFESGFSDEEAYELMQRAFTEESTSGIGMQTADEEIYPEQSEHGDDEPEY